MTEKELKIQRIHRGADLGFLISFDPGDDSDFIDAADSITLPYDAFQKLLGLGKEFMTSCLCTEVIQRWEKLNSS